MLKIIIIKIVLFFINFILEYQRIGNDGSCQPKIFQKPHSKGDNENSFFKNQVIKLKCFINTKIILNCKNSIEVSSKIVTNKKDPIHSGALIARPTDWSIKLPNILLAKNAKISTVKAVMMHNPALKSVYTLYPQLIFLLTQTSIRIFGMQRCDNTEVYGCIINTLRNS